MTKPLMAGLLMAFFLLANCGPSEQGGFAGEIVQKVPRPGGDVVAVITRTAGNATVAFGYVVYLSAPQSRRPPTEVLRFDKGAPPEISWLRHDALLLKVPCAQIFHFSNFAYVWPKPNNDDDFERIVVALENHGVCAN